MQSQSLHPLRCLSVALVLAACGVTLVTAHEPVTRARTPVQIPDVPGYLTLKCDFHIHTVFSDGLVWPSVRSEEAWREGLDAIAITDHIEYLPHKADVSTNHNRAYEIARGPGNDLGVLVIRGSEITRGMPPGHLNAIFLTNATELDVPAWRDSVAAARRQGAFIFWNHPGWPAQLTNDTVIWHNEHTELKENGMLHGIEVVNGRDYYVSAHRWAIEKGLTMLSNSDVHEPLNLDYHVHDGDHRPLTLVFAKERSIDSIKEALLARRTAVYSGHQLIGEEQFLRPIFERSLQLKNPQVSIRGKQRVYVQLHNASDIELSLERSKTFPELNVPEKVTIPGHKTVLLSLSGKAADTAAQTLPPLEYRVTNFLVGPDEPLKVSLPITVTLSPAATN